MGSTLAKFSVSALMFDYILTGPISGVSAGLYLVGLLNELLHYFHLQIWCCRSNCTAAVLCRPGDPLFLVGEHQGHSGIQRKSPAHHVRDHGDGGDHDRLVRLHAAGCAARTFRPCPSLRNLTLCSTTRWAGCKHYRLPYTVGSDRHLDRPGPFGAGHERRRDHGPGLSRNRAPQAAATWKKPASSFSSTA